MGASASQSVRGADIAADDTCSLMFRSIEELGESFSEPMLTEDIILAGLKRVAETLCEQRKHIRIITVGGAVNTLLLRSRRATADVDFFYHTHKDDVDITNLIRVAEKVGITHDDLADKQWLNNHTSACIEPSVLQGLYRQSIQQDRMVFDGGSLKIYAAAWPYAFVQKVIRYGSTKQKDYDIDDAIAYLKEMKEGGSISYEQAVGWANDYKLPEPKRDAFEAIMGKYHEESM